jgi:hypothetical protein
MTKPLHNRSLAEAQFAIGGVNDQIGKPHIAVTSGRRKDALWE